MANLRANRITSTEVFETTGSVQFDGSGDFLTISDSSDFNFGTGDFTIEAWIYQSEQNSSESKNIYSQRSASENGISFRVRRDTVFNPQCLDFFYDTSGNGQTTGTTQVPLKQWNHVALTRSNGTVRIFLNGRLDAINDLSGVNFGSASNGGPLIGVRKDTGNTEQWNGHISNLRVLKGTALYTKNFTPPTRELEVIPNTVLLCAQSKTQANREATGKTITVNGNAVASELTPGLLTNVVKSGGSSAITGSVEFNGNTSPGAGQYGITVASTAGGDFDFGSGSFTIEGWYYVNEPKQVVILGSSPNGNTASKDIPFQIETTPTTAGNGQVAIFLGNGTNFFTAQSVGVGTTTQCWNHFAAVKDGSDVKMYLNGVVGTGTTSVTGSLATAGVSTIFIGDGGFLTDRRFDGFLSNLRIIKGQALYKGNFTPPTRKLTRVPGTVLLCCTDSTNPLKEETGKTLRLNIGISTYSVGIGTTTPNPSNFTPYSSTDGTVVFDGVTKINTPNYFYLPTGPTEQRGRGRGLFGGGYTPTISNLNSICFVNIQSTGNAQDFGDLTTLSKSRGISACSSSTRGIFGGGYGATPLTGATNIMNYITIASTGDALGFGELTIQKERRAGCSNSTRGLFGGGATDPSSSTNTVNVIDYITIASTGNGTDFGDLTVKRGRLASCSSPVRGVWAGGYGIGGAGNQSLTRIDYVIIASTGDAVTFGDLTQARIWISGTSSSTRGIFGGGYSQPLAPAGNSNVIDYVTIASTGNAVDFGDRTYIGQGSSACSNSIRGLFAGGYSPTSPTRPNTIDYVTIATTGNAQDFGDLTSSFVTAAGCSDSHGGLG